MLKQKNSSKIGPNKPFNMKFSLPNNPKISIQEGSIENSCYIIDESNTRIQMDKIFERKDSRLKKPAKMKSMDN